VAEKRQDGNQGENARENKTTATTITEVDNRWADREFEVFRRHGGE
jgi:hypothetical protein